MVRRPPLHVHLMFHPASSDAEELAKSLVPLLMSAPATRGLRVPVFLTPVRGDDLPPNLDEDGPDHFDLNAAERTVVVVLADARMQRRVMGGTGEAWGAFVQALFQKRDPAKHSILLISLDDQGTKLEQSLSSRNFIVLKEGDDLETRRSQVMFHLGVQALLLLRGDPASENHDQQLVKAPIKIFLSHAKADLDKDQQGPVHRVLHETAALPVQSWYDAKDIEASTEFTDAIKQGIEDADLMIVFLTDSWAKSRWCRMEAVHAKRVLTPILVVDALKHGEPRRFPYVGNVRSIRWQPPVVEAASQGDVGRRTAFGLVSAAIQETLDRAHDKRLTKGRSKEGDVALATAPEAAHLAFYREATSFLYPDPPVTIEEYGLLNDLRPNATFETPLMRVALRQRPGQRRTIAVSVSESDSLARYGLVEQHLRLITDEVHLYLLVAGFQIAYGGKLNLDKLFDPDNFTLRLFDLVAGYADLAHSLRADLAPIRNVVPWPLWKQYDDNVLNLFGNIAILDAVPCPDLGFPQSDLRPLPNGFVVPNSPLHRYAWGRALVAMREKVTAESIARVSIGGKIEGYQGRHAGLIEEPLLSLRAGKPLFLVGSLGGCTRLVIDLLEQRDRPEMTTAVARDNVKNVDNVKDYDDVAALYSKYGYEFLSREDLASEIRALGVGGPAKALNNGLTDEENRELFRCTQATRIAELILTGIERLPA